MSMRYQAAILTASYFPLDTPNAPTVGTATAGNAQVSVTFTAPTDIGSGAITSYLVVVTDSSSGATFTNTGASSPIVVTGLTNNNTYTAKVAATNAYGTGPYSASSNSFIPVNQGQEAFTTAGTYSWVCPAGVTSVSVVCIGGGAGSDASNCGGGGGLGYKNNITVVPGNSYTVVAGASGSVGRVNGGDSYFISTATVAGYGGTKGTPGLGGGYVGDGGGNGGNGGSGGKGGGGGGGGYSGAGGKGGNQGAFNGANGSGGGGGGGGGANTQDGGAGGGTGMLGLGANGTGGAYGNYASPGTGGSGGETGPSSYPGAYPQGNYGGGSGAGSARAGNGGVRIIWPGTSRSFPSTNTGDL